MNLLEKISKDEINMFDAYRKTYAIYDRGCDFAPGEVILREWASAKNGFINRVMGGELILSKEIVAEKSVAELSDMLEDKIYKRASKGYTFIEAWRDFIYTKFTELRLDGSNPEFVMYRNMDKLITDTNLIANTYDGETFFVTLPNDKEYKVQKGCKLSRVLGKLAEAFDIPGYEEFRLAHSLVLNEKALKGTMCLSIHPLDFVTMSDNECDWCSCMNWKEDGEYRRGTVEMMNSGCVIMAYIKSANDMKLVDSYSWNNKKWRELFIVSRECIMGIKGYPYWNRNLEKVALQWIKELVDKNIDDATYTKDLYALRNGEDAGCDGRMVKITEWDREIAYTFESDAMYNDIYDVHYGYAGDVDNDHVYINYSGFSQCMNCGGEVENWGGNESSLVCDNCDESETCYECGSRVREDDVYYVNGHAYCRYCYDELPYCDCCEETYEYRDDVGAIYLGIDNKFHTGQHRNLCNDCLKYCEPYKDLKFVKGFCPSWGGVTFIDINSLTDEQKEDIENEFFCKIEEVIAELKSGEPVYYVRELSEIYDS